MTDDVIEATVENARRLKKDAMIPHQAERRKSSPDLPSRFAIVLLSVTVWA
jgi:hypothetical protein